MRFRLRVMQSATNNFDEKLVIGKGGFGKVYKGLRYFGNRKVAIKRLKSGSNQGIKEFRTEIEILSQFQNCNIVPFIGYCDECEEMILVYELMSHGSLADHLHKRSRKGDTSLRPLSWMQRIKICIGAAHGLDYLHSGTSIGNRVIHRDVKSNNILLDDTLGAKISDFGLSKIGPANQTSTYVSAHVKGTHGYLDPYYVSTHTLSTKSDVYAFGVVLFEVLCGRPVVDTSLDEEQMNLANWAQHCFKEGILDKLADHRIKGNISFNSLKAYVDVAIMCLNFQPKLRPTMADVLAGLELALTLQKKSAYYPLVDILPIDHTKDVDYLIHEGNDANHRVEYEYSERTILSNGCHRKKPSSVGMTFGKRIIGLLSVRARAFSGNRKSPIIKVLQPSKLKNFSFDELRVATRNFHPDSMIGNGDYGEVFKGWVDENTFAAVKQGTGLVIAVKKLHSTSFRRWLAEINSLGNLCHPNVVRLLGYSFKEDDQLLVYEFMPQGNLQKHLNNEERGRGSMDWPMRCNIINGIARGILYFHKSSRPRVINRNLNPGNILLDSEMNPKISDFGLARVFGESECILSTSRVYGYPAYMSPEYVNGIVSEKSDVYSFGVIVLEIICGMKTKDFYGHNLFILSYVWRVHREGKHFEALAEIGMGSYDQSQLIRAIKIGLLCVQPRPEDRPTMSMVVLMLTSDIELPQPKDPSLDLYENNFNMNLDLDNISQNSLSTSSVLAPR
ncbi:G-type lectin S-receptor-like serine/threonine-protein kinase SRK isoform X2 [Daucus carota subsp. sativus]|uniref:G-type lectin S-receptor-like serine/threonine-protein kinase SRK isoform X2 n=1 Tax=Daucus carota subsp. sativus TaxID=79200 RepID=UPI0030839CFF